MNTETKILSNIKNKGQEKAKITICYDQMCFNQDQQDNLVSKDDYLQV